MPIICLDLLTSEENSATVREIFYYQHVSEQNNIVFHMSCKVKFPSLRSECFPGREKKKKKEDKITKTPRLYPPNHYNGC